MCLLLHLSKYILIPVLTEWFSGVDLVRLDSGLTNHEARELFLNMVETHRKLFQRSIFSSFCSNQSSHLMFRYAIARGYNLDEYKLVLGSTTLRSFAVDIEFNDKKLKAKFAHVKDIKRIKVKPWTVAEANLVCRLLQCFPNAEELTASGLSNFSKVGQYCKNLIRLDVSLFSRRKPRLDEVFRHCTKLRHFHCDYDDADMLISIAIIVHGRELESLSLYSSNCQSLSMLSVHGPNCKLNNVALSTANTASLAALLWNRGQRLVSLDLNSLMCNSQIEGVRDFNIACPNLVEVRLRNQFMSKNALKELTRSLKYVKHLEIHDCVELDNDEIADLGALSKLETLLLLYIWRPIDLSGIKIDWTNLVVLTIRYFNLLGIVLRQCPNLKDLSLKIASQDTDEALDDIFKELGHIQILDVSRSMNLKSSFAEKFSQHVVDCCVSLVGFYPGHNSSLLTAIEDVPRRFKVGVCRNSFDDIESN